MSCDSFLSLEQFSGFESLDDSMLYQDKLKHDLEMKTHKLRGVEAFHPNEYYGLDLIVKNFLGLNTNSSLNFGLMHGVTYGYQHNGFLYKRRERIPVFTFTNEIEGEILKNLQTSRTIIQLPHLFTLLASILKSSRYLATDDIKKENVFFPPHSSQNWKTEESLDSNLLQELFARQFLPHNTSVMLPLTSIKVGRHIEYEKAGYQVFSAGHPYDSSFLFRWINLVNLHKNFITCNLGGHVFFSAFLGLNARWIDTGEIDIRKFDEVGAAKPRIFLSSEAIEFLNKLRGSSQIDSSLLRYFLGIPNSDSCYTQFFADRLTKILFHANRNSKFYSFTWRIR